MSEEVKKVEEAKNVCGGLVIDSRYRNGPRTFRDALAALDEWMEGEDEDDFEAVIAGEEWATKLKDEAIKFGYQASMERVDEKYPEFQVKVSMEIEDRSYAARRARIFRGRDGKSFKDFEKVIDDMRDEVLDGVRRELRGLPSIAPCKDSMRTIRPGHGQVMKLRQRTKSIADETEDDDDDD